MIVFVNTIDSEIRYKRGGEKSFDLGVGIDYDMDKLMVWTKT
jgi:hypothetical protein